MAELDLIAWIRARTPETGDDCAVLDCAPWGTLLVTTDSVIDGVHADWKQMGPGVFGYKAIARGLSDIAAMGGEPLWAVLAATLPHGASDAEAQELYLGAERAGCRLVGGDTAYGAVASAVGTVLGRAHAKGPALRSGARIGDWIVVSGPLGGSFASGHHAQFTPRTMEAKALMDQCDVGAMIDLSDGLSTDLHHLLDASRVGCRIEANLVPLRAVPLAGAMNDGEDYELLATVRPGPLPHPFVRIGVVTEAEALLIDAHGKESLIVRGGYEHGT